MRKKIIKMMACVCGVFALGSLSACGSKSVESSTSAAAVGTEAANESDSGTTTGDFSNLEDVKWRFSTQTTSGTVVGQMANWIAEEVSARTGGKFTIEVYTDAVLYSDRECIEALTAGSIEAGQGSYGTLSNFVDYCNVVSLPYLVSNWEEANDLCFGENFADARKLLSDAIEAIGLHPLAFYCPGLRSFSNNVRPVNTMADMAGLKVRVQQNDVYIDTFNALGAYPVPMAASEVLVSLQQGTIDAEENPLDFIYNDGFYEFQKYITVTNHIATFSGYYVSGAAWDALPEEYQKVYTDVTTEACQRIMQQAEEEEAKYRQLLAEGGCEVTDLSEDAMEEMKTTCKETVWPKYEDKYAEFLSYFD